MKLRTTALTAALIATTLSIVPAQAKDGVYKATTVGRNGDVTVEVTIKNDKIADIQIADWSETHPIADLPSVQIPADIIKYQTTNVDIVSGATLTSFAIKGAVRDCIKQAGLDVTAFSKKAPTKPMITETVQDDTDVIVIGGGGAGMSAALAAAEQGKKVIVIEKTHFIGGDTCVAGGGLNAANRAFEQKHEMTEGQIKIIEDTLAVAPKNNLHKQLLDTVKKQWSDFQAKKEKGLFDSPEFHALQTWGAGDFVANLDVVYEMCKLAPKTVEHLASIGLNWEDHTTQYLGALWPRSHKASNYKAGIGFIETYQNWIEKNKLPVTYLMQTKAESLIMKDGAVVGVVAKSSDGRTHHVMAKNGVVLATGGFSANVEMRMKYDTIWGGKLDANVKTTNVPGITGDGIVMAEKAGANLIDMGLIQLLPSTDPATGATTHKLGNSTCMFVNKDGKRFVNELERRDVLSKAALAQPDHIFFVITCDATNWVDKDGRNSYGIKVDDLLRQKKVFRGDTIEELAQNAGINADGLKKSIEYWQGFCKDPKNDPFGRASCEPGTELPKGPWWAAKMGPAVHHTMGGVQINAKTQVLDTNGNVIPGLYAAGEITGGVHGTNRVGANAIPDCLSFGRVAGQQAAGFTR